MPERPVNYTPESPKRPLDPLIVDGVRVRTENVLIDSYIEVESVRAGPDTGEGGYLEGVEVRATTTPDDSHWKSLRYHTQTIRAPRARDMLRIIVLSYFKEPPTNEPPTQDV